MLVAGDMNDVQILMERLRPLVGLNSWDYCVMWNLSEDQRFIEWMGCCCGGAENTQNSEEELLYPVSHVLPCRDVLFQHPRTKHCDLLAQLPSSMPLDSGIYTQTLISKQPKWINTTTSLDSCVPDETVGTRVLIPVHGGLIELFTAQNVSENQQIIEFIMAQCNLSWEQEPMVESNSRDNGFPANGFCPQNSNNHFQAWTTPIAVADNLNFPWNLSVDQIRSSNSQMNYFGGSGQQFATSSDNRPKNEIFYGGSNDSIMSETPTTPFNFSGEIGFQEMVSLQPSLFSTATNLHLPITDCSMNNGLGDDKDSIKDETGRADSASDCSDQIEDDNDQKVVGRTGKKHQSKNLVAERRRRKKLNDRLYALRALVPKITKMDRASILGDAIEFVKELQRQAKNLQNELEEQSDEEECARNGGCNSSNNNVHSEILTPNGVGHGSNPEHDKALNGLHMGVMNNGTRCSSSPKMRDPSEQNHDNAITDDQTQQMEVQVEVAQIDGNEFFLKVFCEHKPGGFVRLMEALNSLSLEVTNANVTTFRGLVLNVFTVEKRDSEIVQADHVRDSLLELTRNLTAGWLEPVRASESGGITDYNHPHNQHIASHLHHFHSKA